MEKPKPRTVGLVINFKKNKPKQTINIASNPSNKQNKSQKGKQNSLRQIILKFNTQKCSPKKSPAKSQNKIGLLKERKINNTYLNGIQENYHITNNLQCNNIYNEFSDNKVSPLKNFKNVYIKSTKESPKDFHYLQFNQNIVNYKNNNGYLPNINYDKDTNDSNNNNTEDYHRAPNHGCPRLCHECTGGGEVLKLRG